MFYLCVLLLGTFSSVVLSVAGLILLSSVLFVGIGVAGAIQHEPLLTVLHKAGAVSLIFQLTYAAPLICALFRRPSVDQQQGDIRFHAATADAALVGNLRESDLVAHLPSPTNATAHIRMMIRRIGDRRQPTAMDKVQSKTRPVVGGHAPFV